MQEEKSMFLKSRLITLGGSLFILGIIVLAFFGGRFYESEIATPPTTIPPPTTTTTTTTTAVPTTTTTTIPGIDIANPGPLIPVEPFQVVGLDTELLKLRFGPGTEWPILDEFPNDTSLTVTGRSAFDTNNDVWYEVNNNGIIGWVFSDYAAPSSTVEIETEVIDENNG